MDVHVLAYHYQGVHGQRPLTFGQHNDGIQVHFVDTVSEIISQPRQPSSHFGQRVDVSRRSAAHSSENFCAFEIFQSTACLTGIRPIETEEPDDQLPLF